MSEKIEITPSSGNIFADLGFSNPEERLMKSCLAQAIAEAISELGLTQTQAAERIGIAQPDVSNILKGRLNGISIERLFRCLLKLGMETTVVLAPNREPMVRVRRAA